jgi:hypothetical protein
MLESAESERRLKNLSGAVGTGLDEEIKSNKDSLRNGLNQDFVREITLAEACVYHDDFKGALYHGFLTDMIHRTLNDLE